MNLYEINHEFEKALSRYTGAPYVALVDSCSNAIFLTLVYQNIKGEVIGIPSHTYPSVPCEIIHAGGEVMFFHSSEYLEGAYWLTGTKTVDSALRFTSEMYMKGTFMCLSFTGPSKRLNLGKGGAILTDDKRAYKWFKRARYSGRREKSYFEDDIDMLGWNFMMMPEIALRGLRNMEAFYEDGKPLSFPDIERKYPDLSKFKIYDTRNSSSTGLELT